MPGRSTASAPLSGALIASVLWPGACASFGSSRPLKPPVPTPAASPQEAERDPPVPPDVVLCTEDDFVVRVVAGSVPCSGALIAPDRVLTAHHCVAARAPSGTIEPVDLPARSVR